MSDAPRRKLWQNALIALGMIVVVPPMFIGLLMLLGLAIERMGEQKAEHDRCLKNATNGYEIRQCR